MFVSLPYFDEARLTGKGSVNHFNIALTDPKLAAPVADSIDQRFANSSHETKTESLRELAQSSMQMIGDFDFLIRAVVGAVLVALLFATTTMMIQSIHERTPELAVLKTVGFTDGAVLLLVVAEALLVFLAGVSFGLLLATLSLPVAARFVLGLSMPGVVLLIGLALGSVVALISAAVPALLAALETARLPERSLCWSRSVSEYGGRGYLYTGRAEAAEAIVAMAAQKMRQPNPARGYTRP